jgi:hypothetical protein
MIFKYGFVENTWLGELDYGALPFKSGYSFGMKKTKMLRSIFTLVDGLA